MSDRLVEVGIAALPVAGESQSGDVHLVKGFEGGVLLAAIDGLGHGDGAASVARSARTALEGDPGASVPELFERTHRKLHRTRGVVMSLASLRETGVLSWLGVGNVEGMLLRADPSAKPPSEWILLLSGLIGHRLPRLRPSTTVVFPGDVLVLATDGIKAEFMEDVAIAAPPQQIAAAILDGYARREDDALALVVRFLDAGL